jgi:hypothetical protein
MTITQQALAALQPPPGAPASAWATRISACWQASVKAILEVGRLLAEAKDALPHGAFGKMIDTDLPFTARTAQMLMAIGSDPRITNPKHVSHLPASWGTLYEITKLDDTAFEAKIADGTIRPDMMRRELAPDPQPDLAPEHVTPAPLPNGARAIMGSRVEASDSLDYFPTPPWATRALMERVLPQLGISAIASATEPACGEGHIAEVLREYCDDVFASDIFDYGYGDAVVDWLDHEQACNTLNTDWTITNPPFGDKAVPFFERSLDLANIGVALFVRLQWLEGVGRYDKVYRDTPPTLVAFFAERVPLCKGEWKPDGDTATAYVWLVWVKGMKPQAPFWIPPGQREALTHLDDAARFTTHPVTKQSPRLADDGSLTDSKTGEILGSAAAQAGLENHNEDGGRG